MKFIYSPFFIIFTHSHVEVFSARLPSGAGGWKPNRGPSPPGSGFSRESLPPTNPTSYHSYLLAMDNQQNMNQQNAQDAQDAPPPGTITHFNRLTFCNARRLNQHLTLPVTSTILTFPPLIARRINHASPPPLDNCLPTDPMDTSRDPVRDAARDAAQDATQVTTQDTSTTQDAPPPGTTITPFNRLTFCNARRLKQHLSLPVTSTILTFPPLIARHTNHASPPPPVNRLPTDLMLIDDEEERMLLNATPIRAILPPPTTVPVPAPDPLPNTPAARKTITMTRRSRKTLSYARNKRRRDDDSFSSTDQQATPDQPHFRPSGTMRELPATPTVRKLDFGGSPEPQRSAATPDHPHSSGLLYVKPCETPPPSHPTPPTTTLTTPTLTPPTLIPYTDVPLPPSLVCTPSSSFNIQNIFTNRNPFSMPQPPPIPPTSSSQGPPPPPTLTTPLRPSSAPPTASAFNRPTEHRYEAWNSAAPTPHQHPHTTPAPHHPTTQDKGKGRARAARTPSSKINFWPKTKEDWVRIEEDFERQARVLN